MRDVTECSKYQNGSCTRWSKNAKCSPSASDWFEDRVSQCDINAVCEHDSFYGNDYLYVTDEDIDALKAGKVLFRVGEYGVFIAYKKEAPNDET